MSENLLEKEFRLYCNTCGSHLTEIERYSVLQFREGKWLIDTSGFACRCEEREPEWVMEIIEEEDNG